MYILQQEDNEFTRMWNSQGNLTHVLESFKKFAEHQNAACDAETDSYDVMVLFTGRGDELGDVGPGLTYSIPRFCEFLGFLGV